MIKQLTKDKILVLQVRSLCAKCIRISNIYYSSNSLSISNSSISKAPDETKQNADIVENYMRWNILVQAQPTESA